MAWSLGPRRWSFSAGGDAELGASAATRQKPSTPFLRANEKVPRTVHCLRPTDGEAGTRAHHPLQRTLAA